MRNPTKLLSLGLQHVLAMYAGAVIVPIIIASKLGLTTTQLSYLISIDLLTCGVATLLQVWKNRFFGIGLPVMLGCTFTAVGPMIAIGSQYGITAIYGAILASGLFVFLFASFFGKLIRFFPPVVTGSVVTIIGLTLIPVAITDMGGGETAFERTVSLLLSFGVLIFILLLNRFVTGFLRAISILLGLIAGTVAGWFLGLVDFSSVGKAEWFHMVKPFYFGWPTFEISAIITMILVAIVSLIESTGVYLALGKICDKDLNSKDFTGGYRAEGLATVLGGLFNALPYTAFSQNVGLIQLTKVKTGKVIVAAGGILIVLGLVPKVAAATTIIPTPVLGGAMLAMFGMVVSSGIKLLGTVDLNRQENMLIVACSIGVGLGVTVAPELFSDLPAGIQILTSNGIVAGSFTAILLNGLFNMGRSRQRSGQSTDPIPSSSAQPGTQESSA